MSLPNVEEPKKWWLDPVHMGACFTAPLQGTILRLMILDGNDRCSIGTGIAFNWGATGDLVVLSSLHILVSYYLLFVCSFKNIGVVPNIAVTYTKKIIHSGPVDWEFTSAL